MAIGSRFQRIAAAGTRLRFLRRFIWVDPDGTIDTDDREVLGGGFIEGLVVSTQPPIHTHVLVTGSQRRNQLAASVRQMNVTVSRRHSQLKVGD